LGFTAVGLSSFGSQHVCSSHVTVSTDDKSGAPPSSKQHENKHELSTDCQPLRVTSGLPLAAFIVAGVFLLPGVLETLPGDLDLPIPGGGRYRNHQQRKIADKLETSTVAEEESFDEAS
jgi:hypothetical protein